MKQPGWKRLLSYLTEWHIESAPSAYNPHLYVSLNQGRYQLSTANAVYSFEDKYENFVVAFAQLDLSRLSGKNVLLLGFGLGSVPLILEKNHQFEGFYTGIEIDENVIYLADKYVLDELSAPIQLICADAQHFVQYCEDRFDLIVMDVFADDKVPEEFEATDFLLDLQNLLNPKGLLLYNRLAATEKDIRNTRLFYEKQFKKTFPKASYIDAKGNWILVSDPKFYLNKATDPE